MAPAGNRLFRAEYALNDRIHSFHQKTSRELWKTYPSMENDLLVYRAVNLGFLSKEDVPEKVAEAILLDRHVLEQERSLDL